MASNAANTKKAAKVTKSSRKSTTKSKSRARMTPDEIAWNMPLGVAMDAIFMTASPRDYQLKNKMYAAFAATMDQAPKGATTKHFYMAALDLARVAIMAQAEHIRRT